MVARKPCGVSRRTARRGSGTSSTRLGDERRAAAPGARRPAPRPARGDRRRARRRPGARPPAASTRTATSAAACRAARASPSRRRAKRPELEPPLRWRPCTSRLPTFESPRVSPVKTPAAWPPRRTSSTPTVRSRRTWSSSASGLVAGALAAHGLVERRERRLAHDPLTVGAHEGHVAVADDVHATFSCRAAERSSQRSRRSGAARSGLRSGGQVRGMNSGRRARGRRGRSGAWSPARAALDARLAAPAPRGRGARAHAAPSA